ncbi:MAG: hypothetical protein H0U28_14390, partial [Nocardioidaceae bacterium]|nr:hypothetical protein [Nocardioidaceae bacterium]
MPPRGQHGHQGLRGTRRRRTPSSRRSGASGARGSLPVATVVDSQPGVLTTAYVDGVPGQDLIGDAVAAAVLFTLGRMLTELQSVPPDFLPAHDGTGVLVHHDFGPNNAVLDQGGTTVLLLADWEWCTLGDRLTDLSWCEFIVRMHHTDQVGALPALWDGTPPGRPGSFVSRRSSRGCSGTA